MKRLAHVARTAAVLGAVIFVPSLVPSLVLPLVPSLVPSLVLPLSVAAQDDPTLAGIQAMVARPDAMCGTFVQQRTLVGLSRPVRASGRFCIVAERGIVWRTLQPFESTLRLTRDAIEESHGGRVTMRMSGQDEPAVAMISGLLFSVLAGDLQQLSRTFSVEARLAEASWTARLVPSDATMRAVVGTIDLGGGSFVRSITIALDSGDRTAITFGEVVTGIGALLPIEAELLRSGRPEK